MCSRKCEKPEFFHLDVPKSVINEEILEYTSKQSSNGRQVVYDDLVRKFVLHKYAGRVISHLKILLSNKNMNVLVAAMQNSKLQRNFFRSLQAQTNLTKHAFFCKLFGILRIMKRSWNCFCRKSRSLIAVSILISELSRTGLKHYLNRRCSEVFEYIKTNTRMRSLFTKAARHMDRRSLRSALCILKCRMPSIAPSRLLSSHQGLRKMSLDTESYQMTTLQYSFQVLMALRHDSVDLRHYDNPLNGAITKNCPSYERCKMEIQNRFNEISSTETKRLALKRLKSRVENFYYIQEVEGFADERYRRCCVMRAIKKWIMIIHSRRRIGKEKEREKENKRSSHSFNLQRIIVLKEEKAFLIWWNRWLKNSSSVHNLSTSAVQIYKLKCVSKLFNKWKNLIPSKLMENCKSKTSWKNTFLEIYAAECARNLNIESTIRLPKSSKVELMTVHAILRIYLIKLKSLLVGRKEQAKNELVASQSRRHSLLRMCFKVLIRDSKESLHLLSIADNHFIIQSQRILFQKLKLFCDHKRIKGHQKNSLDLGTFSYHQTLRRIFFRIIFFSIKCQSHRRANDFKNHVMLFRKKQSGIFSEFCHKRYTLSASQDVLPHLHFRPTISMSTATESISLRKYLFTVNKSSDTVLSFKSINSMRFVLFALRRSLDKRKVYRRVCTSRSRLKRYVFIWMRQLAHEKYYEELICIHTKAKDTTKLHKSLKQWNLYTKKQLSHDQKVIQCCRKRVQHYFKIWSLFMCKRKRKSQESLMNLCRPRTNHGIQRRSRIKNLNIESLEDNNYRNYRRSGSGSGIKSIDVITSVSFHRFVALLKHWVSNKSRALKSKTLGVQTYVRNLFIRWKNKCYSSMSIAEYQQENKSRDDTSSRESMLKLKLKLRKSCDLAPAKRHKDNIIAVTKCRQHYMLIQSLSSFSETVKCSKQRKKQNLAGDEFFVDRNLGTVYRKLQDLCRRRHRVLRERETFKIVLNTSMLQECIHRIYRYCVCKWLSLQRLRLAALHARLRLIRRGFKSLIRHRIEMKRLLQRHTLLNLTI